MASVAQWVQFSSDDPPGQQATPYASAASHHYAPHAQPWGHYAGAGQWQSQSWSGGASPYQQQAPAYHHHQQQALVLYNPLGTLGSFGGPQQQQATTAKPAPNPFVPGLAPLPSVPPPKSFVQDDAERALFPNSSRNARDSLSWITREILSDVRKGAVQEATAQRTPLKELRPA